MEEQLTSLNLGAGRAATLQDVYRRKHQGEAASRHATPIKGKQTAGTWSRCVVRAGGLHLEPSGSKSPGWNGGPYDSSGQGTESQGSVRRRDHEGWLVMDALMLSLLLWISPIWASADALRSSGSAWRMSGHHRSLWVVMPAGLELASFTIAPSLGSYRVALIAANLVVVAYLAKIRHLVQLADGTIRDASS